MDKIFVSKKPLPVKVKEEVSVFERADARKFPKKDPEFCPRLSLGKGPKPPQAFPLDVVETALNQSQGPDLSNCPHHGLLPIHGDTKGVKALDFKGFKPRQDRLKAFPCAVDVGNDLLSLGIHEADMAAVLVKVSPVVEEVSVLRIVPRFLGRLLKPVILNLLKLELAVARKIRKLPDGVAFLDPKPKPMSLTKSFIPRPFPDKGLETLKTSKSLLLLPGFTIALDSERLTLWTMLFLTSSAPCLLNRFN